MGNNIQTASLLSYLCGDEGRLHLRIIRDKTNIDTVSGLKTLFQSDPAGDPLTICYRAEIYSDFGSLLRKASLLVQRDQYLVWPDQQQLATNSQIDEHWQRLIDPEPLKPQASEQIFFREQFDENGGFLPFAPVFYCNLKKLFFHPPCSRCGQGLSLCIDNELLGEFGLPHYQKSIHRYLYCPSCTPLHGEPWYTKNLAHEDPSTVKDGRQLIMDFGSIQGAINPELRFPCTDCSNHGDCFGDSAQSTRAIEFFSFYPFYMVTTKSSSCSGKIYLALASGASVQHLGEYCSQRGLRIPALLQQLSSSTPLEDRGFLFPREDSRHFLEVLYLKMQFSLLVAEALLKSKQGSEINFPLATIGIEIDGNSALPLFWSVALSFIGPGLAVSGTTPLPAAPTANHNYTIGLLWLTCLLLNQTSDEAEIFQDLNRLLPADEPKVPSPEAIREAFPPQLLFWSKAEQTTIPTAFINHWEMALEAGLVLLVAGSKREQEVDLSSLKKCLNETKNLLLQPNEKQKLEQQDSTTSDLLNILGKVKSRWEKVLDESHSQAEAEETAQLKNIDDTKTLFPSQESSKASNIEYDETVIIPAGSTYNTMSAPPPSSEQASAAADNFTETQVISSKNPPAPDENISIPAPHLKSWPSHASDIEEELEKTVHIHPGAQTLSEVNENPIKTQQDVPISIDQQPDEDDDFLTETVVLRPPRKEG